MITPHWINRDAEFTLEWAAVPKLCLAPQPAQSLHPDIHRTFETFPGIHTFKESEDWSRTESPFPEGAPLPDQQIFSFQIVIIKHGRLVHIHFFPICPLTKPAIFHHFKER